MNKHRQLLLTYPARKKTHWHRAMACALAALTAAMSCMAANVVERNGPIRVGAVSSLSGPAQFPESSAAVRALFDAVNADGGIRGRRLELVVEDDRGDPAQAIRAARRLVDEQHVVALVGSASIVDCASNAAYYEQANVMSLQGTGIEPACFTSSHVVPVNTGPYLATRNALQFTRTLGSKRPCAFILDLPGTRSAYQSVLAAWSAQSGVAIAHTVHFNPSDGAAALVRQAVDKRCDSVVHTGVEPFVLQWVRAVQQMSVLAGVPTVVLTPAYPERVATELRGSVLPIYCMAEFEPWSSRSMSLTDWRAMMRRGKVPMSSFSQGGYVAAQVFLRLLRDMEGEITRERVAHALRAVSGMQLSMIGTPFSVGSGGAHNPNRAALPMRLEQGSWRIASPFWVVAP
jgi:branched-chain amino acid transport system substrate-binding protein